MQADVRSWLGLATGLAIALIATAIGNVGQLVYLMDVHPGVAGWIQAVFSVAAIIASACLAIFVERSAARREAAIRADARRATLVACSRLTSLFTVRTSAFIEGRKKDRTSTRIGAPLVASFQRYRDLMKGIPIIEISNSEAVVVYVDAIDLAENITMFIEQASEKSIDGPPENVQKILSSQVKVLSEFCRHLDSVEKRMRELAGL